ncbi:MAG: PEP-CTERM sorting domain-containing protein [Armatimonadota bacterium]
MVTTIRQVISLFVVLMVVAAPCWADLSWSFENPPYALGGLNGQDGWTVSNWAGGNTGEYVSDVNPIAGDQSLLINIGDTYTTAHHSLAGQTFVDGTTLQFLVQPGGSEVHASLNNAIPDGYLWIKFAPQENVTRVFYAGGYSDIGPSIGDHVYQATSALFFSSGQFRVTVQDMTDPSAALMDSGLVALNPNTTVSNAVGEVIFWGIGQARFDNVSFSSPVPEPSALLALGCGLIGFAGLIVRRKQ